jgi:hypothetical protein
LKPEFRTSDVAPLWRAPQPCVRAQCRS